MNSRRIRRQRGNASAMAALIAASLALAPGVSAQTAGGTGSTTIQIGQSVVLKPGTFCLSNEPDGAFIYDMETPFRWPVIRMTGQPGSGPLTVSDQALGMTYSLALDHGYYLDGAGNIELRLPGGQFGTDWHEFQNSPRLTSGFACGGIAGAKTTPLVGTSYGTGVAAAMAAASAATAPPSPAAANCAATPASMADAIICETNKARTNPAGVAAILRARLPYYSGNRYSPPGQNTLVTNEGRVAVEEAIRFLENQPPLPPLARDEALTAAAQDWVGIQGPKGGYGHNSDDGKRPADRVIARGGKRGYIGENISYGPFAAADHVLNLIVDDGVANRGHRTNIYKADYLVTGASCGPHNSQYRQMCVMVYSNAR